MSQHIQVQDESDEQSEVFKVDPERIRLCAELGAGLHPDQLHALRCEFFEYLWVYINLDVDDVQVDGSWPETGCLHWISQDGSGSLSSSMSLCISTTENKYGGLKCDAFFDGTSFIPTRVALTRPACLSFDWMGGPLYYAATNHWTKKDCAVDLPSAQVALDAYKKLCRPFSISESPSFWAEMLKNAPFSTLDHMIHKVLFDEGPERYMQVCIASERSDAVEVLALMRERGWSLDEVDEKYGETPLMKAALRGDSSTMLALLEAGANVEAVSADGKNVKDLLQDNLESCFLIDRPATERSMATLNAWCARDAARQCLSFVDKPSVE